MALQTTDLTPRIGTEIRADQEALLSGAHAKEIRRLLEARGVLAFRQLDFTDKQQVAFAKTLGSLQELGEDNIYKITMDVNENAQADYLKGAFYWHIDGTMDPIPGLAAMMTAVRLAPVGGETEFCNTYAAYDDLPEADKKAFEKLRVVHTFESSQRLVTPNPSPALQAIWDTYEPKEHPLVWTHQSGRKSLVLGVTISHIKSMSESESRDLIDQLMDYATQPKFVYRHTWALGDLVIWDNTGTMHRATPYALDSGRMMHRTALLGEETLQ